MTARIERNIDPRQRRDLLLPVGAADRGLYDDETTGAGVPFVFDASESRIVDAFQERCRDGLDRRAGLARRHAEGGAPGAAWGARQLAAGERADARAAAAAIE